MKKAIVSLTVALAFVGVVSVAQAEGYEAVDCVQVVTLATNPETGEVVEFGTPCDVPEGWEVVAPVGLEFEIGL